MGRRRATVARSRMSWRHRLVADRARLRWWAAAVAAAALAGLTVQRAVAGGEAARARWGRERVVLVTEREVRAGQPLADAVSERRWPVALVPPRALARLPRSAVAAADLDAGTAVTASALRRPGRGTAGRRTVAVPLTPAPLPVRPGDEVDAWTTVAAASPDERGPLPRRVAVGARVVTVDRDAAVLAVRPSDVAATAAAAASGAVILVGTP